MSATSMPTRVDELTPQWLGAALSVRSPGTVVESVDVESIICAEMARRHVSAAIDHNTLAALEV